MLQVSPMLRKPLTVGLEAEEEPGQRIFPLFGHKQPVKLPQVRGQDIDQLLPDVVEEFLAELLKCNCFAHCGKHWSSGSDQLFSMSAYFEPSASA